MELQEMYAKIENSIVEFDQELLEELTREAVTANVDMAELVEMAYTPGIRRIGELFESGEIFLPELVFAGKMFKDAVTLLEKEMDTSQVKKKGKFLIGTVAGDIHDIGKDLVAAMVATRGIDVIDIGVDCPPDKFIDKALEHQVDIIGASCLLTMTAPELVKIVSRLKERGVRDQFYFVVGGAAIEKSWAEDIGADGFADDLQEAVKLSLALLEKKKEGA